MTTDTAKTETPKRRSAFELLMFSAPENRVAWPRDGGGQYKAPATVEEVDALSQQMFTVSSSEQPKPIHSIVLCGSTRFLRLFHEWNAQLSTRGYLVWSLGVNRSKEFTAHLAPRTKAVLDAVHFQKIACADAVVVITGEGSRIVGQKAEPYIGESTAREIAFAESLGRPVFYADGMVFKKEYTQPRGFPWANYDQDQLQERIRETWRELEHMLNRSPTAMLALADSVWDCDADSEESWDGKIDVEQMAEMPEEWPTGARHALHLSAGIGSCILVVDENEFDEESGEQRVRWHLEPMTEAEEAERRLRHQEEMRRLGMGKMVAGDLGLAEAE